MSLKKLQEISSLVTNYTKRDQIKQSKKGSKSIQLLEGLLNGKWDSENEAAEEIYHNNLGNKTFAMLKTRAKEQLVNQIFHLDTQKRFKSSYDKSYFKACKKLVAGALLLNQNRNLAGIENLTLALSITEKYDFTDLSIVSSRLLRASASFAGNWNQFNKYSTKIDELLSSFSAESEAEKLNQELIIDLFRSIDVEEGWSIKVKKYYERLQEIVKNTDTYTTRINMYRVGIRYFDSIYDYKNAIRLATECEEYLHARPHLIQKVRLGEMNLNKLYGALHLRDYTQGSTYAETCMTLFNPGTLNWLIFLEYYFLLCLHTRNYEKAAQIYTQVLSHPGFASYPPQNKEKWKIFEAFLIYVLPEKHVMNRRFNVAKFINEVPLFSKDKAGYNLSIIIAQIILLLKLDDYTKILDKAESIKTYAARYIRKDKNPRSYYFLKMVLVMIRYDFDPKKSAQIAEKFFQKLKASHLGGQSELETLEVIPYDQLWPEILQRLEKNKLNS